MRWPELRRMGFQSSRRERACVEERWGQERLEDANGKRALA